MQKTITLLAVVLIGTTTSFSFAAQTPANKASQVRAASKPAQAMPHDGTNMPHGMSGMKH